MIAMTIISSISVNPASCWRFLFINLSLGFQPTLLAFPA